MKRFKSDVFKIEDINIGGTTEQNVRGGRDKFPLLDQAFRGINQIGFIGWGSQGPAQAQNMRDTLAVIGSQIKVKIGIREGSKSIEKIKAANFTEENGTLGEMYQVINESDFVILLISDSAQAENFPRISRAIKPGAILGFSHGFELGYLESLGNGSGNLFDDHYSVIAGCPKGMGPSVLELYKQGKDINGAGINCSFAVEQDLDGRATDVVLGWIIGLGAPYGFPTTLHNEYISDLVGERGVLLGGVIGYLEARYGELIEAGKTELEAFRDSVEQVTGVISPVISKQGIIGVYNALPTSDRYIFERAFSSAYYPYYWLIREIYDEVASGNEIRSVVMAGKRPKEYTMGNIEGTRMWKVGEEARARRMGGDPGFNNLSINPFTAGGYIAMMYAQIKVFLEKGHCLSEICNETVIEAVDSLTPFMHARGPAHMADNCSETARLGTRKCAPRFDHVTRQQVMTNYRYNKKLPNIWLEEAQNHPIHDALAVCATMRPPVDIFVP